MNEPADRFRAVEVGRDGVKGTNRIPDDKWEEYKPHILEKYIDQKRSLKVVKQQMREEHGFEATIRQYVHHIGTVWGIKKYKKGGGQQGGTSSQQGQGDAERGPGPYEGESSSPNTMQGDPPDYSPHNRQVGDDHDNTQQHHVLASASFSLATPSPNVNPTPVPTSEAALDQRSQLRLFATILFAYGDSLAFGVYKDLCKRGSPEMQADLIACTRAAQTQEDAEQARATLQDHVDDILNGQDDKSALATLVDLQAASTYDWGSDKINAKGQIEQRIGDITSEVNGNLDYLLPRPADHHLDLPLYSYLNYAVKRWNEDAEAGNDLIDVDSFLDQFLLQQPVYQQPARQLSCLPDCLAWCIDILKRSPAIPRILRNNSTYQVSVVEAAYQVLGTLWVECLKPPSPSPSSEWIRRAETELGISGAELLANVVCMIIAQGDAIEPISSHAVISEARRRAGILNTLRPDQQLSNFLQQFRLNSDNDRRYIGVYDNNPDSPTIYHRFRRFAFQTLPSGFKLVPVNSNAPIFPLVVAPVVIDMGYDSTVTQPDDYMTGM